jgi:hypothetical protein
MQQRFELFADYYQFYLQDEAAKGDLSDAWTETAVKRLLAIAPGTLGVGTARNNTVPVTVEVLAAAPIPDFEGWDQVVECALEVPTGRIVIAGTTDYFPDAARLAVAPGAYAARISYGALASVSADGLTGADYYRVQLWPGKVSSDVAVIKARAT